MVDAEFGGEGVENYCLMSPECSQRRENPLIELLGNSWHNKGVCMWGRWCQGLFKVIHVSFKLYLQMSAWYNLKCKIHQTELWDPECLGLENHFPVCGSLTLKLLVRASWVPPWWRETASRVCILTASHLAVDSWNTRLEHTVGFMDNNPNLPLQSKATVYTGQFYVTLTQARAIREEGASAE